MKNRHRELGKITSVRACDYRGEGGEPNTVWVQLEFKGSGQGFGGLSLDANGIKAFVSMLMVTCGVINEADLIGKQVYALRAFSTWNEPIVGIECAETGRRFTLRQFRVFMGYPGGDESAYDQEVESVKTRIAGLERNIKESRANLANLKNDYVEWD